MAEGYFVPGADDVGNILVGAHTVTPSSEDALFPKKYLNDGDIGPLFRFAAAAANDSVIFDLDKLDGGFESWGASDPLPPGWTDESSGTGAIARETTIINTGSVAAKLTGGGAGNEARLQRSVRVMAGWAMTISLAIRGDGTNSLAIYVRNSETGRFLLSNESWSTTKTAYATRSMATYGVSGTPADITIEAASVGLRGVYTLDIWAEQVTGSGYVDDFYLWPHWDFAAVFNHNLGTNITARVRSDNNVAMSSPTNRVAFTLRRPAFFGLPAAMVTERFAQFYCEGTNPAPGEFGELALAQKQTQYVEAYSLAADAGIVGDEERPRSLREDESLSFPVSFLLLSEAEWNTARQMLFGASRWGGRRSILVPLSTEEDVYYGTWRPTGAQRIGAGHVYKVRGDFAELGYAIRAS